MDKLQHSSSFPVQTEPQTMSTAPQLANLSTSCDAHAGAACDDRTPTTSSDLEDSSPFCIRGYVAAVREIDIARCWPFSQKLLEESIGEGKDPLLPPLTPLGCEVKLQREYYDDGALADMDATVREANEGPQLQVQIDLSKCHDPDASKPENSPDKDEFAPRDIQEACSPHKKPVNEHVSPFPNGAFVFKRQAPRSIREIRKSIMQGCQCFKRMGKSTCTKDACSNSQNVDCMDMGGDAFKIDDNIVNLSAEMGGLQKKHVANNENVSVITEIECCGNDNDIGRKGQLGILSSHVDERSSMITRLHESALGAGLLVPSCDMRESGKEFPLHAISESTKTSRECSLESQSIGKSIESQNSKSFNSRPRSADIVMQHDTLDTMPGSDNVPHQRCPVCLFFQCSSNTALNAHIDRCLVASSTEAMDKCKAKLQRGKVRKKRSMAELCQVAPPCGTVDKIPLPGPISVPSQELKESNALECFPRKRIKLLPLGLEDDTIATGQERNKKLIKSQAQALQFLQWRSRSAPSSSCDLQIPHGTTRRSALQEARLASFKRTRFRSRNLELKANSVLRTKHWKRQKLNHEPAAEVRTNVSNVRSHEAHRLENLMQREKQKCTQQFQENVSQFLTTLQQTSNLKASKEHQSKTLHKDELAASNSKLCRKRKPSKQIARVRTSDTVVTVKGSHKTTFEFLRPNDQTNQEQNQVKKVKFRVHVKSAKKRNKQRPTAADVDDAIIQIPSIPQSVHSTEGMTSISNRDLKDSHNQKLLDKVRKAFKPIGSALAREDNSSPCTLRRLAEEVIAPEACLPLLSSTMQNPQPEVRMPPIGRDVHTVSPEDATSLLHCDSPHTNKAGKSRIQGNHSCFVDIDNVPLLSLERQPHGLRNRSGACASESWHSLLSESRQVHVTDSQQASLFLSSTLAHNRGASMQKCRAFPFSLCADEFSEWPRDSEKANFLITNSEHTTCCRPSYQFTQPAQIAKLAQMVGTSNRCREFATRQETVNPRTLVSEAGIHFSIQPEALKATCQLNQGSHIHTNQFATQNEDFQIGSQDETWQAQSAPQRLPAWMQTAIHQQRSSAMSSVDLPTNSGSQSILLNTTPCISREVSGPSPTFDMIRNPVLRLMGKTMVLMPESHQNQVDLNTNHFSGSSNYINFFQSLNSGEAGQKQQWNINRVQNLDAQRGEASQGCRSNNGVHSWISSDSCSTPQLQDFFLRMSSSSPAGNSPLPKQQAGPHLTKRNIPAQDANCQWLDLTSSSLPSGMLQSTHSNWQHQKVPATTIYQPHSNLFCQHSKTVPGPPFFEGETSNSFRSSWKQKQLAAYRTTNPVQNLSNLPPQYPKTGKASPLPCWLSNINRTDQPATVVVLDDEGPLCSFDMSAPGSLREEVPPAQTRAKISDTFHSKREKQNSNTFIPIIYTVGSGCGDSHCTPVPMRSRLHKVTGDFERRDADRGSGAVKKPRERMDFLEQARCRTRISHPSGGSPTDVIRVGKDAHSIAGESNLNCALKHIASVEALQTAAERMKSLPTRGPNYVPDMLLSGKLSNVVHNNTAEASPPLDSQTPRMGMCSVNMNPAEVDCQDAGQFMSTPTLVSSFRATPAHNGGDECIDNRRMINASSQAHGSSSFQSNSTANRIHNAALPAIPPVGPNPETLSLRNYQNVVLSAKAPGKENNNAPVIFNMPTKKASFCGDLSTAAINIISTAANPLADGCSNDADTSQECSSARMQPLKVTGKFRIINGRVSMMYGNMVDAANDKQWGDVCTNLASVNNINTEGAPGLNAKGSTL